MAQLAGVCPGLRADGVWQPPAGPVDRFGRLGPRPWAGVRSVRCGGPGAFWTALLHGLHGGGVAAAGRCGHAGRVGVVLPNRAGRDGGPLRLGRVLLLDRDRPEAAVPGGVLRGRLTWLAQRATASASTLAGRQAETRRTR